MDDVPDDGDVCAICLDPPSSPIELRCGHTFCRMCAIRWLTVRRACPMCRALQRKLPRDVAFDVKDARAFDAPVIAIACVFITVAALCPFLPRALLFIFACDSFVVVCGYACWLRVNA